MIKYPIKHKYQYDGGGTEEVTSSTGGVAPVLSISYNGTAQTGQEFTKRNTGGGSISGEGTAIITDVKGNVVMMNQLYDSTEPTALTNHKYFIREKNGSTIAKSISSTITFTQDSTERNCIDLTLIYGKGAEPSTVEAFEADYYKWFGENLSYLPYDAGSAKFCKMTGIKTRSSSNAIISEILLNVTTIKGTESGSSTKETIFPDGMLCRGDVRDEIDFSLGKAIKRLGVVDFGSLSWTKLTASFYASLPSDAVQYSATNALDAKCSKYIVVAYASLEEKSIALANNTYIYCKDSDYSTAPAFTTANTGTKLIYELATPIEYDIDMDSAMVSRYITDGSGVAQKVKKVYVGSNLIYEEDSRRLPAGYTELSYIEATGSQYINTGFTPDQDTKIRVKYSLTDISKQYFVFGCTSAGNANDAKSGLVRVAGTTEKVGFGDGNGTLAIVSGHNAADTEYEVYFNKNVVSINGSVVTTLPSSTWTALYPIFLCTRNNGGVADTSYQKIKGKIFRCEIWDDDTKEMDLIPAKRDSDSAIGLYDLVGDTFIGNSGTGSFTAGSEV